MIHQNHFRGNATTVLRLWALTIVMEANKNKKI